MGALFRASEHANNYLVEEPAYFLVTFTKDGPTEETEELYRGSTAGCTMARQTFIVHLGMLAKILGGDNG